MQINYEVQWDPTLPTLDELSKEVRAEVWERVLFCISSVATFQAPFNTEADPYVPAMVQVGVWALEDSDEPGYIALNAAGGAVIGRGLQVTYYDSEDGSNGSVVYRDFSGALSHWM